VIPKFIDNAAKKRIMFSFIIYFPIISLAFGTPIPLPSIFEPSQGQVGLLNGINLSISIIGSIIGVGFYLRKKSQDELNVQNKKIDKLDEKIDEKSEWLYKEMKGMETRICNSMEKRAVGIERATDDKVKSAKDLEDERIRSIHNRLNRVEGGGKEGYSRAGRKNDMFDNRKGDEEIDASR